MSLVAATTSDGALIGSGRGEAQKFGQCRGAGLVQSRPQRHLDGLQIQTTRLAAAVENGAQ